MAPTEVERLQYFLDEQRNAVLDVVDGLSDEQMHTAVLPSGWTPAGMLVHLAGAEAMWFGHVAAGGAPVQPWPDGVDDPPYDPAAALVSRHAAALVIDRYRRQCQRSNEVLRSRPLDAPLVGEHGLQWPGEPISDLRWVALHVLEETARHAGHLDAARELLDGATGRGPR